MNQELDVEAETFLYRGELLLRGKESFVAGFSGSGKTISGCATRRDRRLIPASKTLTRGGLTIQVPTVSENSEAQNISSVLDCVSRNIDLK